MLKTHLLTSPSGHTDAYVAEGDCYRRILCDRWGAWHQVCQVHPPRIPREQAPPWDGAGTLYWFPGVAG